MAVPRHWEEERTDGLQRETGRSEMPRSGERAFTLHEMAGRPWGWGPPLRLGLCLSTAASAASEGRQQ